MKTMKKVLSIALALVLCLSVFVLPASALDNSITIDLVDTVVGVDANGNKLHRIVAYADSTHSLYALQLGITYDTAAFYPVNATTLKKLPAPGTNAFDKTSTDIIFNADADVYADYLADGYYAGDDVNADYGYAYFASDVSPKYAKMSNGQLGTDLVDAGFAGFYWTFATDFGDNYLIPSGGDVSSAASPLRGKVALCAVYLAEQADIAAGTYTIGVNGTQVQTVSGTYVTTDVIDSISIGADMVTIPNAGKTYNSVTVTIADAPSYVEEADTIVSDLKWQWRDNGDGTYAMRNLATIDGTALNQYLNDADLLAKYGDIEAVADAVMVDFGFIVAKGGTMTKAEAAAWHQSADRDDTYAIVNPTYLNTTLDGDNYVMSYLIDNVPTADADVQFNSLGYVVLDTDDDGTGDKYYYYADVTTSTFNEVKA